VFRMISLGAITRVLTSLLLAAGFACAQEITAQADRCPDLPVATALDCLPEAPSAIRHPEYFAHVELAAGVMAKRKLSPAERPYQPLTRNQKFHRFVKSLYSPYALFNGAYDATWAQATGDNYRYGGGMEGWGNRLGAAYAGTASRQFLGTFLFPALLRQDPRYFAMYHGSVWSRFLHAAGRTVLTKGDNGHTQLDVSGLLAIGATETLENTWLPAGQRSMDKTLNRVVGSLQATATSYILREFTPDLVHLFKKHSPKRLRRWEDKIPEQLITGVPPDAD
jgi:hypothetical protein